MDYAWYLFGFEGRINRARYWLAMLIIICWMMFLLMFLGALTAGAVVLLGGTGPFKFSLGIEEIFKVIDPGSYRSLSLPDLPVLFSQAAGSVPLLWVFFATSVKRLHDRDKSGWWMIPFFVVPAGYNKFAEWLPDVFVFDLLFASASWFSASGVLSSCTSSRARERPTSSGLTRSRLLIRGRVGSRRARSKWCRTRLMPTFRSSRSLAATTFRELRKAMGISRFTVLVPLFDLKSLTELAACAVGTSNRRH